MYFKFSVPPNKLTYLTKILNSVNYLCKSDIMCTFAYQLKERSIYESKYIRKNNPQQSF